jgi:hypothetical protein
MPCLQVDLPEDPNLKDFTGSKPAFASKSNTPRKSDSPRTSTGSRVGPFCVEVERQAIGSSLGSAACWCICCCTTLDDTQMQAVHIHSHCSNTDVGNSTS